MVVRLPSETAHWRDSARSPRLFFFDAKAIFPFMLLMLHIEWWTFFIALATAIFLTIIGRYGFTVEVFLRWLRSTLAGPRKISDPWWM